MKSPCEHQHWYKIRWGFLFPLFFALFLLSGQFLWWAVSLIEYGEDETAFALHLAHNAHFGEMFVPVHALAEILALAGVITALLFQQRDLKERAVMFSDTMFQGAFFPYLSLFNQYVTSLSEGSLEGRECPSEWKRSLKDEFIRMEIKGVAEPEKKCFDAMCVGPGRISGICNQRGNHIAPYCQHLTNLLRVLDVAGLERNKSRKYIEMIEAQLSPDEGVFVLFFALSGNGKHFRELAVKHNLLPAYSDCFENGVIDRARAKRVLGIDQQCEAGV